MCCFYISTSFISGYFYIFFSKGPIENLVPTHSQGQRIIDTNDAHQSVNVAGSALSLTADVDDEQQVCLFRHFCTTHTSIYTQNNQSWFVHTLSPYMQDYTSMHHNIDDGGLVDTDIHLAERSPRFEDPSGHANVTVQLGGTAFLNCRVLDLQDKTVCAT